MTVGKNGSDRTSVIIKSHYNYPLPLGLKGNDDTDDALSGGQKHLSQTQINTKRMNSEEGYQRWLGLLDVISIRALQTCKYDTSTLKNARGAYICTWRPLGGRRWAQDTCMVLSTRTCQYGCEGGAWEHPTRVITAEG